MNGVTRLPQIIITDGKIFFHDITKHAVYTFFIVLASSTITYLLLRPLVQQNMQTLMPFSAVSNSAPSLQSPDEALYTERGSPYDNRTVENATQSSMVIFHGPRDKKKIALTFDAEMTEGMKASLLSGKTKTSYDKRIVDTLRNTKTKATFFLTGMWIELYPDITKDLSNDPLFELGSHSYSDSSYHGFCYGLKQIPSTLRIEEIGATEKLLRIYAGIDNKLFRFPGGCYTPEDVALVQEADDSVVHWDVAGQDGFNTNVNQIIHNVVDNVQNGSIIILHMNGSPTAPKTADALPNILSMLKARGYEFVKTTELLGMSPIQKVSN